MDDPLGLAEQRVEEVDGLHLRVSAAAAADSMAVLMACWLRVVNFDASMLVFPRLVCGGRCSSPGDRRLIAASEETRLSGGRGARR